MISFEEILKEIEKSNSKKKFLGCSTSKETALRVRSHIVDYSKKFKKVNQIIIKDIKGNEEVILSVVIK